MQAFSRLVLAVAQLPLLTGARVHTLEVPDEDTAKVSPVVDLVAWQVLEPRPCRVTEVERQVLYDEEIICRFTRVARESIVFEPHARVGVPVVPGYVGWSSET
jgi:hypothetical protein